MSLEQWILVTNCVSTVALAIFTGLYVYLTRKLVESSNKANLQAQHTLREQIRAMTAPYLWCAVKESNGDLHLKLSNVGSGPAYDVDVLALGHYHEDDFDVVQFVAKDPTDGVVSCQIDNEGFFHVYDRIVYGHAFPRSEVDALFAFPQRPQSLSLLLQYRDLSGENHTQIYWFFESLDAPAKSWKLGACVPRVVQVSPRVELGLAGGLTLEDEGEFPAELEDEYDRFKESFEKGISSGYFHTRRDVEDRGQWRSI